MKNLYALPIVVFALILGACASIGRPEGGPRDEDPPIFSRANPMPGELNVNKTSLAIYFDENVQIEDAFSKVIVSPVQIETPKVSANGKRVSVELGDTLMPNMTYTIDFGDAIKDLNEGNVLDGFALDFSTGDHIDTMRISGIVLEAKSLEPAQNMLVGAYNNLNDTAIHTLPPLRVARTNQLGQFTIRNLAPGKYRIYALNDLNRDYHWDRSEDIAYLDTLITPSIESIEVTDTLYDSKGNDSLVNREGIRYLPNDLLLLWFNQNYKAQYLKDYKRIDRIRAMVLMAAKPDSMPQIKIVGGEFDGMESDQWSLKQYSAERDSIVMWITDSLVSKIDSLQLSVRYRKPDSLDVMHWTTDTLKFFYHEPKQEKKKKKDEEEADTLPPRFDLLKPSIVSDKTQEINLPLTFKVEQPLASIDTTAMRLEIMVDSLWEVLPPIAIKPDSLNPMLLRHIHHKWEPGAQYRFTIDSAAIHGIYGIHNPKVEHEFKARPLEEYSNLTFVMAGVDSTAVVELLNSSGSPVLSEKVVDGIATFKYVKPASYYARMYFDSNHDGRWTTGQIDSIQPEEVAYYPKKLQLKANWDVEENWDIYDLPIDKQKPYAILKNKPKLKRGEKAPVEDDEEDDDDLLNGPSQYRESGSPNRGGFGGGFKKNTGIR